TPRAGLGAIPSVGSLRAEMARACGIHSVYRSGGGCRPVDKYERLRRVQAIDAARSSDARVRITKHLDRFAASRGARRELATVRADGPRCGRRVRDVVPETHGMGLVPRDAGPRSPVVLSDVVRWMGLRPRGPLGTDCRDSSDPGPS